MPAPRDLLVGQRVRASAAMSATPCSARRTSASRCSHSRSSVRATSRFSGSHASNWRVRVRRDLRALELQLGRAHPRLGGLRLRARSRGASPRPRPGAAPRTRSRARPARSGGRRPTGSVRCRRAGCRVRTVVGHERLAAVADLHLAPAAPAADQPLQQRPALARSASAINRRRWGTVRSIALKANRNPTSALITANSVVDSLVAAAARSNSVSS